MYLQTDPQHNPITTRPIQMDSEIAGQEYSNSELGRIDDPDSIFGEG